MTADGLDKRTVDLIVEDWIGHVPLALIAERFGVSRDEAMRVALDGGGRFRPKGRLERDDRNVEIRLAWESGATVEDLGSRFGLKVEQIKQILHRREFAGRPGPVKVVPTPTGPPVVVPVDKNLERDLRIAAARDDGWSLEEIGAEFGVTRERARQVLRKYGRTGRVKNRKQRAVEVLAGMVHAWVGENPLGTQEQVREALGLTGQEWYEVMATGIVPKELFLPPRRNLHGSGYTRADAVKAVRRVYVEWSADPGWDRFFSSKAYSRRRDPGEPSGPWITSRWSWAEACTEAGVPTRDMSGRVYTSHWSDEDMRELVRLYAAERVAAGLPVTYNGMNEWLQARPDAPSGTLVRLRLGGRGSVGWTRIVQQAVGVEA